MSGTFDTIIFCTFHTTSGYGFHAFDIAVVSYSVFSLIILGNEPLVQPQIGERVSQVVKHQTV